MPREVHAIEDISFETEAYVGSKLAFSMTPAIAQCARLYVRKANPRALSLVAAFIPDKMQLATETRSALRHYLNNILH